MIIGNAISGPALAVERLLSDVADKRHESETRLAFGATKFEAVLPTLRSAVYAALLPSLNQMAVVGLVSIPGMMTGQLLGGASPLVAAEYQMSILWLIFATVAVSTLTAIFLAITKGVFDNEHRLTEGRIIKRSTGKMGIEQVVYRSIISFCNFIGSKLKTCCSCFGSNRSQYEGIELNSVHGGDSNSNIDDTIVFESNQKLHKDTNGSKDEEKNGILNVKKLSFETGRVIITQLANTPLTRSDIDRTLSLNNDILFCTTGLNVLSGEIPLFPTTLIQRQQHIINTNTNQHTYPGNGNGTIIQNGESNIQLYGLSLTLRRGEIITVEGPSGLGKTRLLRAMAQLDKPFAGYLDYIFQ